MNNVKKLTVKEPQEPHRFVKRLGSTTFHVSIRFSETSRETADDKIARMIRNDMALGKVVNL
jgi:hypothetical protein